MTLIKSISGIRGTIGGKPNINLTPVDIVNFASAYGSFLRNKSHRIPISVVVGRDARISGRLVEQLVSGTLLSLGLNVINIGLATTPTTAIAVKHLQASGGIILTASHNPKEWNALKMLNENGEMISSFEIKQIISASENADFCYASVNKIGKLLCQENFHNFHIEKIISLELVDTSLIKKANFRVAVDAINSVGGVVIPPLLRALGVEDFVVINKNPTGNFAHNPEPLPENLTELSTAVVNQKADVGFAIDPDVDRLAIVNEDGTMFGEEYTLVAVANYVLSKTKGTTVSNLSSSRALQDITESYGCKHFYAAVGELNVVSLMKKVNAIVGGEGNGGVIYPANHYVRDALVGMALFLTALAQKNMKCSELKKTLPTYHISKNKISTKNIDMDIIFSKIKSIYHTEKINETDGLRIDFQNEWIHLRKSNTEPVIRIYAESETKKKAEVLSQNIINKLNHFIP